MSVDAPHSSDEESKIEGITAADALRVLSHRGSGSDGAEYKDVDAIARASLPMHCIKPYR